MPSLPLIYLSLGLDMSWLPFNFSCFFVVFIRMSIVWIYVMSRVRLSVLPGINFNVRHYTQLLHAIIFIPAQLFIGAIDFYHFIPLSPTFWPCLGVTRSARSNNYWLHILAHLSSDQDKIWYDVWGNSSWTSWEHFWGGKIETRGITAFYWLRQNILTLECIQTLTNRFDSNLIWW